jgi:hypothetical protein
MLLALPPPGHSPQRISSRVIWQPIDEGNGIEHAGTATECQHRYIKSPIFMKHDYVRTERFVTKTGTRWYSCTISFLRDQL